MSRGIARSAGLALTLAIWALASALGAMGGGLDGPPLEGPCGQLRLGAPAFAPPGMGGPGMAGPGLGGPGMVGPGPGGPDMMLDTLDLRAAQRARLRELRRARRDRLQKLENAFQDAREDFGELLAGPQQGAAFEKAARAKHAELAAAQQALDAELFDSILEVRGLLSPAQLKKFNERRPAFPPLGGMPGGTKGAGKVKRGPADKAGD